jgi:hypothetical protein
MGLSSITARPERQEGRRAGGGAGAEDGVEIMRTPSRRGSGGRVLKAQTPRAKQTAPPPGGGGAPSASPLRGLRLGSLRHALSGAGDARRLSCGRHASLPGVHALSSPQRRSSAEQGRCCER